MSTPDIMLSPHYIAVRMRAVWRRTFSANAVKAVLFGLLRHYRLVMTELSF
jgi:hypothetical protein